MNDTNDLLEKYFQAAREEVVGVSFAETKFLFEMNAVPPMPTSFMNGIKSFFSQQINIVYTAISASLVTSTVVVLSDFEGSVQQMEPEKQVETVLIVEEMDSTVGFDRDTTYSIESDESLSNTKEVLETTNTTEINEEVKDETLNKKSEVLQQPTSNKVESVLLDKSANQDQKVSESDEHEKKHSVVNRGKPKPTIKLKPPFKYTFTPQASESELRKLQEDLKQENITLHFSKLKYKNGVIDKVAGTIELEGYFGTFTTDEFDDFTFTWSYSKYKGGLPDKFDIIINTPMKKKSNTAINIDELE